MFINSFNELVNYCIWPTILILSKKIYKVLNRLINIFNNILGLICYYFLLKLDIIVYLLVFTYFHLNYTMYINIMINVDNYIFILRNILH